MPTEKTKTNKEKFIFPYIGHGICYYRKLMECYIVFKNDLTEDDKKWVETQVPEMLRDFFEWEYNVLHFGSDDGFPYHVFEKFNEDEEKLKIVNEGVSDEIGDIIYDEIIWEKYHSYLDESLMNINKKNSLNFVIKGLDFEYGYDLDEWHEWSTSSIPDIIIPYFYDIIKLNKADGNKIDLSNHCWILNNVFWHYLNTYEDLKKLNNLIKDDIIKLISYFNKYDEYIDTYNFYLLIELLYTYNDNEIKNIFTSLSPYIQLSVIGCSEKGSELLLIIEKDNPVEYLKKLIEQNKNVKADHIYKIGNNIANIKMEDLPGKTGVKITANENSKPLLGAEIVELCFDLPDANEAQFIYAGVIYNDNEMYDKSLKICEKALEKGIVTPQIFTNIVYTAHKMGDQEVLDKYLMKFIENEKFISDPFSLSNIVYLLNRKEMCDQAVKLTESYLDIPNRKMLASLYINLSDTYIVANLSNEYSEKIINESLQMIELNKDYFGANLPVMLGNIACIYAVKDDKENVIKYIKLAKENNYPGLGNLKNEKCFKKYYNDDEFNELFEG